MPEISEIVGFIVYELQETADHLFGKDEMDCMRMHGAFLEQWKEKHGSYKIYIGKSNYWDKMDHRDDCLLQQISETIEARLDYERKELHTAVQYASRMGCI